MAKMRVHELAKELDRQNKEVLAFLQEKGIEIKSVSSSIEEDVIALVKRHFTKNIHVQVPSFLSNQSILCCFFLF